MNNCARRPAKMALNILLRIGDHGLLLKRVESVDVINGLCTIQGSLTFHQFAIKMPKASATPKTVIDKIIYAIRNQPQTANGVSRSAIVKYLKAELDYENPTALKKALKKGVQDGKLVQTGQSFRVEGDPLVKPPPEERVKIEDIKAGTGRSAEAGDTVVVEYEGTLEDDTRFDTANSFEFVLGAGDVIKGWDQGIAGLKVGGCRKLEVPSKLGYGKRGSPPDIPPDARLFFKVVLKKIKQN